jgi:ribosomal protein S18 acetylase RimI-like enzyme
MLKIDVREAKTKDFGKIEEILIQNVMLEYPKVDGKERMEEVMKRMGRYFLVANLHNDVVGFIRGCYDGSRAVIHQFAVEKEYQNKGIGKRLMNELASRLKEDGAPTIGVVAGISSENYYRKLDFYDVGIVFLVATDINDILEKTK